MIPLNFIAISLLLSICGMCLVGGIILILKAIWKNRHQSMASFIDYDNNILSGKL